MGFYKNVGVEFDYVERVFHPVGQGAMYSETFHSPHRNQCSVLYDCGGDKHSVSKVLDDCSLPNLKYVFLSHFHEDHINGIAQLMEKRKNSDLKIYVPYVSPKRLLVDFVLNLISSSELSVANDFILHHYLREEGEKKEIEIVKVQNDETVVLLSDDTHIWKYLLLPPVSSSKSESQIKKMVDQINKVLGEKIEIDDKNCKNQLIAIGEKLGKNQKAIHEIKQIFKDNFPEGHNSYSMAVLSKPYDAKLCMGINGIKSCLYLGDAIPSKPLIEMTRKEDVDMIQAPHHGSIHNFNPKLYSKHNTVFMSVGEKNRYHHPGKCTLNYLFNHCKEVRLITECPRTQMKYILRFVATR